MYQSTHEKLYLTIDQLENDSVLTANQKGYRLSFRIWKAYLNDKNNLENIINNNYDNCNYTAVIRERAKKEEESPKHDSFDKLLSPKFSGNLAFDIVASIFWLLSGSEKKFLTIEELINHLLKGWCFID